MCSRPAKLPVPDKGVTAASYTTFDGLTVDVKLFQHDSKDWLAVALPAPAKRQPRQRKSTTGSKRWVYAIPSYKAKMMETKLADLLAPPKGS